MSATPVPGDALQAFRARVRRSLDDPRPSLTADEAEAEMARFLASERQACRQPPRFTAAAGVARGAEDSA